MVHRPSDSRLLVNLLSQEKDYSKQLATLLDHSQSSLASFSAYASASAPPTSQIIIQVAGALAGVDEALRKYAGSLEQWQEQLKGLKGLEEEVGNVMRDREILVTRLIKLSKSQKPTRDSILASSSTSTLTKLPEVQTSGKLASAQSELQACEAHLAAKERELDVMRNVAIKSGLSARCKALVECGWTWGEMGKEGLRALESMEGPSNGNGVANGYGTAHTSPTLRAYKPLPDGPSSDLSSIGPSQSASQTTHGSDPSPPVPPRLHIPPAHSISDHTFPVEEEEEPGDGSSVGEEEGDGYVMRENERFSPRKSLILSKPKANGVANHEKFSSTSSSSILADQTIKRQRRSSNSVLGSIAAFFHKSPVDAEAKNGGEGSPTKKGSGRWQTRTDKHLAQARKGKGKGSDSDDDATLPRRSPVLAAAFARPSGLPSGSPSRLRKNVPRGAAMAGSSTTLIEAVDTSRGVMSDGGLERPRSQRGKKKTKRAGEHAMSEPESAPEPISTVARKNSRGAKVAEPRSKDVAPTTLTTTPGSARVRKSSQGQSQKPNGVLHATSTAEASISLSRNSSLSKRSITSAASAPVDLSRLSSKNKAGMYSAVGTSDKHSPLGQTSHKRAASLDGRPEASDAPERAKAHKRGNSTTNHPGTSSRTIMPPTVGNQSLMSIVEDVAKQNRTARAQLDPNRMLFVAKAPPPLSDSPDFLKIPDTPIPVPTISSPPRSASTTTLIRDRTPSQHSLPITPSTSAPALSIVHNPSPDLKPLRSAMRNNSRSPSPVIMPLSLSASPPPVPTQSKLRPPLAPQPSPPAFVNTVAADDDTSSISSYETTNEILDEDDDAEETDVPTPHATPHISQWTPPPPAPARAPAPPPKEAPAPVGGSQVSNSTSSSNNTATNSTSAPTRRKSVRMSLPPTFSATPPALDDADDDDEVKARRHEPWSQPQPRTDVGGGGGEGWRSRIKEPVEKNVWHDSSESEDEEYNKARRLLGRMSRKK
ncbi:hypothetical protein BDW22DRAFT_1432302 [Trametopsis cervina]|nr:hypothetical protein BDW22DRAFT_1432302 [Trametopsis cervina]